MTEADISIALDGHRRTYWPGEVLSGEFALSVPAGEEAKAVEVSVLWYTEGKGDEDLDVHFFERFDESDGPLPTLRRPRRFSTALPASPLSYEGRIVKIRWCVRVRVFPARGKEVAADAPFQLGDVPAAGAEAL